MCYHYARQPPLCQLLHLMMMMTLITTGGCVQVVKGSEDHPSQYMNFMNVVFTAQKLGVVVDACILDNESGLLQQVIICHI